MGALRIMGGEWERSSTEAGRAVSSTRFLLLLQHCHITKFYLQFRLDLFGLLLLSSVTSCVTLGCVFLTSQLRAGSTPTGSPFGQVAAQSRGAR